MFTPPTPQDFTLQNGFGRDYVDTLANKYIVKPKNATGIGGFVFDYDGDTQLEIDSDITDHFAEDNKVINDHVAIHPTVLRFRGYVGELVFQPPQGVLGAIDSIQSKLTTVDAYLGKYTPSQVAQLQAALTKADSVVNTIDQSLSRVRNVVGLFSNSVLGQTKQVHAYGKLSALMFNRALNVVVTPFGTFNNMLVKSVTLLQDEKTKFWSDVTVTLKQLRFVQVESSNVFVRSGRNAQQAQPAVNKGETSGTPALTGNPLYDWAHAANPGFFP